MRTAAAFRVAPMRPDYDYWPVARPRPERALSRLAGVAGEDVGGRVDDDGGVVDRGGGLAEADRDQPHLAGVLGDVAGGEDPRQVGAHRGVDHDVALLGDSSPHSWIGPRSAMKPSAATTACAGRRRGSSPSTVISTSSRWAVAAQRGDLGPGDDLDAGGLAPRSTVRSWARNASRRCTSVTDAAIGSRCSAQSKALSPPPTMTTSLPAYGAKLGTKNSMPRPTQPSPAGSGRGLNLPMPAVMSTAPARDLGAVVEGDDDRVVVVLERGGGAVEEVRRVGGGGLRDQPLHQVAALDAREAGDVEDRLLGVHRRDLAAELGQRVDDGDPQPAEARVVGGVQAGGAGADDQQVGRHVVHAADPSVWASRTQWPCPRVLRGRRAR